MNFNKILVSMLLLGIGLTSGCQTTEGFGKDLQKVGEHIEEEADRS